MWIHIYCYRICSPRSLSDQITYCISSTYTQTKRQKRSNEKKRTTNHTTHLCDSAKTISCWLETVNIVRVLLTRWLPLSGKIKRHRYMLFIYFSYLCREVRVRTANKLRQRPCATVSPCVSARICGSYVPGNNIFSLCIHEWAERGETTDPE